MIAGDGEGRWIVARGEAVRGPDGKVVKLRGTAQDVTARKRFEEESATGPRRGDGRHPGQGRVPGQHEPRDPDADERRHRHDRIAPRTPRSTTEQQSYAETIRGSGEALLTVINDILDFSKIEAGKMTLEIGRVRPPRPRRRGRRPARPEGPAERARRSADEIDPAIPGRLLGDPVRIRQVLLNLAGNAVKFTDRGRVDLEADLASDVRVEGDGSASWSATPASASPRTARPTSSRASPRSRAAASRRHGGTGLGLTICRSLVGLMGGEIGLESRPGRGEHLLVRV